MIVEWEAPQIDALVPTSDQQIIIDAAKAAVEHFAIWDVGRGAGKSTLRAMIAQAILDADPGDALYSVEPVTFKVQR